MCSGSYVILRDTAELIMTLIHANYFCYVLTVLTST